MTELRYDPKEPVVPHSTETHRRRTASSERLSDSGPQAANAQRQPPNVRSEMDAIRGSMAAPMRQQIAEAQVEEPSVEVQSGISTRRAVRPSRIPLTVQPAENRVITAAHSDITLPSECVAYEWKDIQIRRFTVNEIRGMIRARTSGNLRHLIRAVDGTITRPITDLTTGDFWFIMYWHRINSYKKTPFLLSWTCTNHDHLARVENGEVAKETLKQVMQVTNSNLNTVQIDVSKYQAKAMEIEAEYQVKVTPQRLVDFIAALEEEEELLYQRKLALKRDEAKRTEAMTMMDLDAFLEDNEAMEVVAQDDERGFMYRYAALIFGEDTLAARSEMLGDKSPDLLDELEELAALADHGVSENWTVVCKECGASETIEQSLDALTFLPSLQRGGFAES